MITIKLTRSGQGLSKIAQQQLPFATALALTQTVRDAQTAMQRRMPRVFTLRGTSKPLFERAVKTRSATKQRLSAQIRIDGPQSGDIGTAGRVSRLILRHERGGTRTSTAQYRIHGKLQQAGFFLPVQGLRGATPIPRKYYPANIGIAARRAIEGGTFFAESRKGRKKKRGGTVREFSYFATPKGIYERRQFGSGSAIRLLWAFRRQVQLTPRLGFGGTTTKTIKARWGENWNRAFQLALRTAKVKP